MIIRNKRLGFTAHNCSQSRLQAELSYAFSDNCKHVIAATTHQNTSAEQVVNPACQVRSGVVHSQCPLHEGGGLQGDPIPGKTTNDLHTEWKPGRISNARDVDAGGAEQGPEPVEGGLAS